MTETIISDNAFATLIIFCNNSFKNNLKSSAVSGRINNLTPPTHALADCAQLLTSILADFNGVAIQARWSHDLWLAPDDGNRSVVLVFNEQIHWSACGLCKTPRI